MFTRLLFCKFDRVEKSGFIEDRCHNKCKKNIFLPVVKPNILFMKKWLLFSLIFAGITVMGWAAPIGSEEALQIARTFYQYEHTPALRGVTADDFKLVYVATDEESSFRSVQEKENGYYYIFNVGEDRGFVIIAGDDRVRPVLGYSFEGRFQTDDLPSNIRGWMDNYKDQIKSLSAPGTVSLTKGYLTPVASVVVEPLLGNIKWDQDAPYNDLCPEVSSRRTVTGCVATAMAQIMKYHCWPVHGTGFNQYKTNTHRLSCSADFENTVYDWGNMLDQYRAGNYTEVQAAAVATLMYHCGVAADMDYNLSENGGSGSTSIDGARALFLNFGYDQGLQIYYRDYCPEGEWVNLLKKEIDEGRPVFYTGSGTRGGHAFVCDGYTRDDMFHFNWGWSGSCDGYYEVNRLNPLSVGIGGGGGDFNQGQGIFVGVKKPADNRVTDYQLLISEMLHIYPSTVDRTGTFHVSTGFFNMGAHALSGEIAIGILRDTEIVEAIPLTSVEGLNPYTGWNDFSFDMDLPETTEPGDYRIAIVYKDAEGTRWLTMRAPVGMPSYVDMEVTATKINFSEAALDCGIELTSPLEVVGDLYCGREVRFRIPVANKGSHYYSYVTIKLTDEAGKEQVQTPRLLNLAAGEQTVLEFTVTLPGTPGVYEVTGWYDEQNSKRKNFTLLDPSEHNGLTIRVEKDMSALPETAVSRMRVYPVPANETVTVESPTEIRRIHIATLAGRLVRSWNPEEQKKTVIPVDDLTPGYYLLQIETAGSREIRSFIKR